MTVAAADRPAEGSILGHATLNRTLLARQHLLERRPMAPDAALRQLVGLQAQNPRDPYIALWSRLAGFDPLELSRLLESRAAVRLTVMRGTLHLVAAADAGPMRAVLQPDVERMLRSSAFWRNLQGTDVHEIVEAGVELVEEQPRSVAELARLLAARWPDRDPDSLGYAVRYLVPLAQVTPRGMWDRTGQARVTTLHAWLGLERLPRPDPDELVVRYLRAFGPAHPSDIRAWSGLTNLRPVIDRLRPSLVTYRDDAERELLDVPDGRFADAAAPAPVRFLPEFDNVFLSHADRSRVTGDDRWGPDWGRRGVILVDGFFAAAWRIAGGRGEPRFLSVEPRRQLSAAERDEVEAEARRLMAFLRPEDPSTSVRFAPSG